TACCQERSRGPSEQRYGREHGTPVRVAEAELAPLVPSGARDAAADQSTGGEAAGIDGGGSPNARGGLAQLRVTEAELALDVAAPTVEVAPAGEATRVKGVRGERRPFDGGHHPERCLGERHRATERKALAVDASAVLTPAPERAIGAQPAGMVEPSGDGDPVVVRPDLDRSADLDVARRAELVLAVPAPAPEGSVLTDGAGVALARGHFAIERRADTHREEGVDGLDRVVAGIAIASTELAFAVLPPTVELTRDEEGTSMPELARQAVRGPR